MTELGLESKIVDARVRARTVQRLRDAGVLLPRFAELAEPERIAPEITDALRGVDPDAAHPLNLFRVHWHNSEDRIGFTDVPGYVSLTEEVTGVRARILIALGNRFPMIHAHKVLAAYACLAPRLVTGQFDPSRQRAVWPSTGNYCRGGVAISKILGCRALAVLPEGMSSERFEWLERWLGDPGGIVRTPGSESNVKEIYDACAELAREPDNVVFNQFSEFGNHLVHWLCTGTALSRVFEAEHSRHPGLELRAFVSASGSAGTLAAGDRLAESYGSKTVAVEALECPTLLYNGFGAHNIQGIGDKHVPLIHNVMRTDIVTAISDRSTDGLYVLFNTDAGRAWLEHEAGLDHDAVRAFDNFGLSSLCNILASIKIARHMDLGPDDAIVTVATDGAEMYRTELDKLIRERFAGSFTASEAEATFREHLRSSTSEHLLECSERDRERIFNLAYFTWVEQRGVSVEDFVARRDQTFWRGLRDLLPAWDALIDEVNRESGVAV